MGVLFFNVVFGLMPVDKLLLELFSTPRVVLEFAADAGLYGRAILLRPRYSERKATAIYR